MNHISCGEDKISKIASVAVDFLQKVLDTSKQLSFLDIGCGDGRDIHYISTNFDNLRIKGIDISSSAINKAIKLNSNKNNVIFERKDWVDLDNTRYDIIYISGVYHFFNLDERTKFVFKIRNVLKSEGYFILSTLSSNDTQYFGKGVSIKNDPNSFQDKYFIHFSSKEELLDDFKFLRILNLSEFFHKNYAKDTDYHTMWILIGKKRQ